MHICAPKCVRSGRWLPAVGAHGRRRAERTAAPAVSAQVLAQQGHHVCTPLAKTRRLANDIFDVVAAPGLRVGHIARATRALVRSIVMAAPRPPFHIAIFCRPLIAGHVKTRLIPAYGANGSAFIYAQLVERTLRTVSETEATASLWVVGDTQHASVIDWARRYCLPAYAQCEGDLGERMSTCLAVLAKTQRRVLLIGTDCPTFTAEILQDAAAALGESCHWVFTPAEDGGYVLVGSNAPRREPFAGIAWSTDAVMQQTRSALRANGLLWAETTTLWDVDEAADVKRASAAGLIASVEKTQ